MDERELYAAAQLVADVLPEYQTLCAVQRADAACAVDAKNGDDVLQAVQCGYDGADIYYTVPKKQQLESVLGKCRLVASSLAELQQINAVAAAQPYAGRLIKVGLRLCPEKYGGRPGISVAELPEIAHAVKRLTAISVGGCFVCGDLESLHGRELGRFFRVCYETAKQMTVILPCAMPYLCVDGAVEAVYRNQKAYPETLEDCLTAAKIVAMQNETAFYARLLIR